MRAWIQILMVALIFFGCGGKAPDGPDVGPVGDADADTDTDTDTDADTDADTDTDLEADEDEDGFAVIDGDCDDDDPDVRPDADELCNGIDDDCDGEIDEDDAVDAGTWYTDGDGDGYGDDSTQSTACDPPAGAVDQGGDCDDTSGRANPGADEECDEVDNNCDGTIDESDAIDAGYWYTDEDGDGYGVDETELRSCGGPSGMVTEGGDCQDDDPTINPAATDTCDGIDNDCDGGFDEDVPDDWYAISAMWEEMDTLESAYPVWVGALPGELGVWAVVTVPSGDGANQPAFLQYVEGVGFERRDTFDPGDVNMDARGATVDSLGQIWVAGRLETTPGVSSTAQVLLLRFDPETLEVTELHFGEDSPGPEFAQDITAADEGVYIAGKARNILGQFRAVVWSHDGSEPTVIDSEGEDAALDSHAVYNAVHLDDIGRLYLGGAREDVDGIAHGIVRGGEIDEITDILSYSTSSTLDLNDLIRSVTTDEAGHLWFTGYHQEGYALIGATSAMFDDWRLYTGPPEGPFEVVDSFSFATDRPSFGRSVAVHPSGVVFTSGVAMDTEGGTHLVVRAGSPPDMFTSLNSMRDPVLSKPNQGTYARPASFDADGSVWLIEGWLDGDATTETGEETHNTRIWRMTCL